MGEKTIALHIKPIDMSQPGSYRLRRKFRDLPIKLYQIQQDAERALRDGDEAAITRLSAENMAITVEMEDLVVKRAYREDGGDVEEALDLLSADGFDELFREMRASPVPTESAES